MSNPRPQIIHIVGTGLDPEPASPGHGRCGGEGRGACSGESACSMPFQPTAPYVCPFEPLFQPWWMPSIGRACPAGGSWSWPMETRAFSGSEGRSFRPWASIVCGCTRTSRSFQAAAARIGTSLGRHSRGVSFTADPISGPFAGTLPWGHRVGVYTDRSFHPAEIARNLIACGVENHGMVVLEDLGLPSERIRSFEDLSRVAGESFSASLVRSWWNVSALWNFLRSWDSTTTRSFHEQGLITKQELRAVGLSLLRVEPGHVVWDLGSGSGAVAIEASRMAREGMVFAVEQHTERVERIRSNVRRAGAYVVEAIHGTMPGCLEGLPDPDRVFLGGGAGSEGVLETVLERLRAGGRLVIHVVLLGSLERTRNLLEASGWSPA